MVNHKKYDNRYITTFPFERDVFFYLKENLPNGVTIADEVNSFLKERVEQMKKEKEEGHLEINNNTSNYIVKDNNNKNDGQDVGVTLDLYLLSKPEIIKQLDKIKTIKEMAQMEEKGKLIHTIAHKRKMDLIAIQKLKNTTTSI